LVGARILLIATGGISLYKSAYLVRLLARRGAGVRVVMTEAATRFVTPLTFETLSRNPVATDMFAPRTEPGVLHVELAGWADIAVVAPATADFIARAANGLAPDLAGSVLSACRCPVIFAPAMNEGMWLNPATARNIETLRKDGRILVSPEEGELACGDSGRGRMAEPDSIAREVEARLSGKGPLNGLRVLVTAGRTEEDIDQVRYISNRSSGRMGFALAEEAAGMGADVTLIHGYVDIPVPPVAKALPAGTAAEMKDAVLKSFEKCDILVMAAAVSDFTPLSRNGGKIRRESGELTLKLKKTDDILELAGKVKKSGQIIIGFALETDEGEKNALNKLRKKNCDYMVLNMVGGETGFEADTNSVTVYGAKGRILSTPVISKREAASFILKELVKGAGQGGVKSERS